MLLNCNYISQEDNRKSRSLTLVIHCLWASSFKHGFLSSSPGRRKHPSPLTFVWARDQSTSASVRRGGSEFGNSGWGITEKAALVQTAELGVAWEGGV